MATHAYQGAAPAAPDLSVLLAAIPSLPRAVLARLTARMVDRLDEIDGDPDLEPNGDEEDGSSAEDDWRLHAADGPGCPISDPDCGSEAEAEPDCPEAREPYQRARCRGRRSVLLYMPDGSTRMSYPY